MHKNKEEAGKLNKKFWKVERYRKEMKIMNMERRRRSYMRKNREEDEC